MCKMLTVKMQYKLLKITNKCRKYTLVFNLQIETKKLC